MAQLPPEWQIALVAQAKERGLTARETEREVARIRGEYMGKPAQCRGAVRRFGIGAAVVDVRFRKRDATDGDVLDALERVCRLVKKQANGEVDAV